MKKMFVAGFVASLAFLCVFLGKCYSDMLRAENTR